ncbi:hypothetical protein LINPERHAP2_LOCUS39382 [Linum perenne]
MGADRGKKENTLD